MSGRTILNPETPTTQTAQAVAALLKFCKRPSEPMPSYVELNGNVRLTRSKKGDCYYTTSLTDCSCKARTFNPGTPCKHMKALAAAVALDESRSEAQAYQAKQRTLKGRAMPTDSIIERKPFRPFIEDEAKPAASIPLVDCLGEPTPGELAYHSIQEDKILWPCEA